MIVIVDNYDSFTYNLVQALLVLSEEVEVVRNDTETAAQLLARSPEGIVLSPGPGRPEDAGICPELMALEPSVPVLGVCLGHQVLGITYGATVDRAEVLMHGKTSKISHDQSGVFADLPNPFEATRYHSLAVVESTLPEPLQPLAWSDDGVLMGMCHRRLPYWGVQFQSESILTETGPRLLANVAEICHHFGAETRD